MGNGKFTQGRKVIRDLDQSDVARDGERSGEVIDYDDGLGEFFECGKPCNGCQDNGTMAPKGLPCWRLPNHDGQHVCPMCPDAMDIDGVAGVE